MIRLLEPDQAHFLGEGGVESLLCGLDLAAYENRYPFSQVWGVLNGKEILRGGLSLFYQDGSAWAEDSDAAQEIVEYLSRQRNWKTLLCDRKVGSQLLSGMSGLREQPVSHLSAWGGGRIVPEVSRPHLRDVYQLLSECDPLVARTAFDGWYCDWHHRIRRKISRIFGVYEDDILVATLTASQLEEEILLSDVATREEYRKKGYCRRLLCHIRGLFPNKRLHLLTESQWARHVYESAGFKIQQHDLLRIHKE